MQKFKSHFKFNKQERSGIFFLLGLIILFQVGYVFYTSTFYRGESKSNNFSLDEDVQAKIEVLKQNSLVKDSVKVFPFNPNYITDYKGYKLGMSANEIDRLHSYRASGKFVNSAEEFQKVTLISDSLLQKLSPTFKFPDWVRKEYVKKEDVQQNPTKVEKSNNAVVVKDLNSVTAEELKTIYGIGDKLSARIINFRDKLGGFLIDEQLFDVYGLESTVAQKALSRYKVLTKPKITKININTASAYEISKLVYLNYTVSKNIVEHRQKMGKFKALDDLQNVDEFPSEKINRIALYLTL